MATEPVVVTYESDHSDAEDSNTVATDDYETYDEMLFEMWEILGNESQRMLQCDSADFHAFMTKAKECMKRPGDMCQCFPDVMPRLVMMDSTPVSVTGVNSRYKRWRDLYETSDEIHKIMDNLYDVVADTQLDFEHFMNFVSKYSNPFKNHLIL
jgi:hypothetical protein